LIGTVVADVIGNNDLVDPDSLDTFESVVGLAGLSKADFAGFGDPGNSSSFENVILHCLNGRCGFDSFGLDSFGCYHLC